MIISSGACTLTYPTLDYSEVKILKDDPNYILIDVRQPEELEVDGKIPGAINIPRELMVKHSLH